MISTRKIIRRNCRGVEFSIPENMLSQFAHLDEAIENSEFDSNEEQDAIDTFHFAFAEYQRTEA